MKRFYIGRALAISLLASMACASLVRAEDDSSPADAPVVADAGWTSKNQVLEIPQQCDKDAVAILCDKNAVTGDTSPTPASSSPSAPAVPEAASAPQAESASAPLPQPDSGIAEGQYGSVDDYQRQNDPLESAAGVPAYGGAGPVVVLVPGYSYMSPSPAIARPWVPPSAVFSPPPGPGSPLPFGGRGFVGGGFARGPMRAR